MSGHARRLARDLGEYGEVAIATRWSLVDAAVLEAAHEPRNIRELMVATGLPRAEVGRAVGDLLRAGQLVRLPDPTVARYQTRSPS